jgi:hypothetical protein
VNVTLGIRRRSTDVEALLVIEPEHVQAGALSKHRPTTAADPGQPPADLLGRLPELDTGAPEEALAIYAEISAALAAALDAAERPTERGAVPTGPVAEPTDWPPRDG